MDIKHSDRLKLRVEALRARLDEVSNDLEKMRVEAGDVREKLQESVVSALVDGRPQPEDAEAMRDDLAHREAAIGTAEAMTVNLREQLLSSRRDHLRQLKLENPGIYINLDA